MVRQRRWKCVQDAILVASLEWLHTLPQVDEVLVGEHRRSTHRYPSGWVRVVRGRLKGYTVWGFHDVFVILKEASDNGVVKEAIAARAL